MGSSDIKVTQDEAVTIARTQAKTLNLSVPMTDGSYQEIPVTLQDEPLSVTQMVVPREPFTLHPLWYVLFSFDKPVSGTTGAQVGIWADNGQIAYCQLVTHHGEVDPQPTSTEGQTPPTNNGALLTYILIGVAACVIASVLAVLVVKRKK
jgi:hypothetical protein